MNMTIEATKPKVDHRKKIDISIDGRPFTIEDRHHTAAELLALAGLPAAGYDLTRVGPHGKVETFRDGEKVNVKDGDVFVSVNQQGTVA
jgi:Multiubiquitin